MVDDNIEEEDDEVDQGELEDEFEGLREAIDCSMLSTKASSVASVAGIVSDAMELIDASLIV